MQPADVRLCFIGDSFIAGVGDDEARGWVGRVVRDAPALGLDFTAYNLGVRRETAVEVTTRLRLEAPPRLKYGGVAGVVFSTSVNDTTLDDEGTRASTAQSLLPSLAVAGAGARLFLAPVTGVIIAGLPQREAGSASGVLATAQQVGAALGIALVGVLFFGLLGSNSGGASSAVTQALQQRLSVAQLPAPQRADVVHAFDVCFSDRAHAKDPAATPASCAALEQRAAAAPAALRTAVTEAVLGHAVPDARRHDFSRTLQEALLQLGVLAVTFVLVLGLPRIKHANLSAVSAG